MNSLLAQFLAESREALAEIGDALLRLERAPGDASHDELTALFRHVHTLKGNSGLFDVPEMTRLLHAGEDLLDAVRHGAQAITPDATDDLLGAADLVGALCDALETSGTIGGELADAALAKARRLRAHLDDAPVPAAATSTATSTSGCALSTLPDEAQAIARARLAHGESLTHIEYQPAPDCFFQGDDPLHQMRTLPEVCWGRIRAREAAPPLAELDAYRCSFAFEALSTAPIEELRGHLRYVAEAVTLRAVHEETDGATDGATHEAAHQTDRASVTSAPGLATAAASARMVRVDQARIDRLMGLIGEMVVARNGLPYLATRAEAVFGSRELAREIKAQHAVVHRIVEELQDTIMQVRLMPVSVVTQRFPRLVRDLARQLGKDVQLVVEGEDTEADKHIIEALADPLVHIVRNSLDHGFEAPEVREAAGKPRAGTLRIVARSLADRVHIEVIDDGRGIDPARIRRRAVEKGLLDAAAAERLTDGEAVNLVFAPGFSTRDDISDLSGRGVGMDVVRTAIQQVYGTVHLESTPGRGTRLVLSLPLSMAVTTVMKVEVDGQRFGVPMDQVLETVRVPRVDVHRLRDREAMVRRGQVIPLRSAASLLGLASATRVNAYDELAVLVVRLGAESVGLVVDEFRGSEELILKPMTGVLAALPAYSGSALLGDGSVLMILNLLALL